MSSPDTNDIARAISGINLNEGRSEPSVVGQDLTADEDDIEIILDDESDNDIGQEVKLNSSDTSNEGNEGEYQRSSMPVPTEPQYSMNAVDYQLGPVIGFGSSAIVYLAKYKPLGTDVSVKMIELDQFERNRIDELRKEIQVMALCKHPNLLGNLASFVQDSKLWIVTPFLSGGSCLDIMKIGFKEGFEEDIIAAILYQALMGLEYLHRNGHIHRDVKCGNLLMAEDGLVQLADFGVSSSLADDGDRRGVRKTYVGTPCWMAPEVMEIGKGYDFKADIWSFGITALELAYGHAPYAKFPPMKVIYLTLSGKAPTLDRKHAVHKYSKTFKDFVDLCLQKDPNKRPGAADLLKHPFFRSVKKKSYLLEVVMSKVPPVHLRDKAGQLRARGLAFDDYESGEVAGEADTVESWDFSVENSVIEEEAHLNQHQHRSEADVKDEATQQEIIAEQKTRGLHKSRTSRFIIDTIKEVEESQASGSLTSSNPQSASADDEVSERSNSLQVPESLNRSASPNESLSSAVQGSDPGNSGGEVKKGRFSVVENAADLTAASLEEIMASEEGNNNLNNIGEQNGENGMTTTTTLLMEDEKKSRFEVSALIVQQGNGSTEFLHDQQQQQFINHHQQQQQLQQQQVPLQHYGHLPDEILFAQYGHISQQQQQLQQQQQYVQQAIHQQQQQQQQMYPLHAQHHRQLSSSTGFIGHHHHYPYNNHSRVPSISSAPLGGNQIDHLLYLNEYIRNQLIELRQVAPGPVVPIAPVTAPSHYACPQVDCTICYRQQPSNPSVSFQRSSLPAMNSNAEIMDKRSASSDDRAIFSNASASLSRPMSSLTLAPETPTTLDHQQLLHSSSSPVDLNANSANNATLALILKELEGLKRENELLRSKIM